MIKQYVRGSGKRTRRVTVQNADGREHRITKSYGGPKVGLLVAVLNEDGKIVIGHAKWHRYADEYDADFAADVVHKRIVKESIVPPALSLLKPYKKFMERAQRYYQGAEFSESVTEALAEAEKKMLEQRQTQAE